LDYGVRRTQKNVAHAVLRVEFEPMTLMLKLYNKTHAVVKGLGHSDRLSRLTLRRNYARNTML